MQRWYNGTKTFFSTNDAGTNGHTHVKKNKVNLDMDMTCFTKINSKYTIDLNVKSKIINILANSIGENIDDLWYGFLDTTPKAYGEGNDNPLQYSCLEKSRDRGAWRATVHGIAKSWTQLSNQTATITIKVTIN